MISVARKSSTYKKVARDDTTCFGKEITGIEVTNPKTVLGLSLCDNAFCDDGGDIGDI
jgi:hypothetical protein